MPSVSRSRAALVAVALAAMPGALGVACAAEADTEYGPPDYGPAEYQPGPVRLPLDPDADATAGSPEGGPGPLTCDGGAPDCAVSWSATLFPKLTGTWGCAHTGCHGDGTFPPTIAAGDASAAYAVLASYMGTALSGSSYAGEPFVLPCGSDPMKSTFLCSVSAPTCGTALMPLTTNGAAPLGTADLASISTWIACGAPNN